MLPSEELAIPNITDIINFDAPDDPKIYVHRVGRSARMGKDGRAFTLYGYEQRDLMEATMRMAKIRMNHIDLDTAKYKDIELPQQQRHSGRGGRFQRSEHGSRFSGNRSHASGARPYGRRGGGGRGGRREGGERQRY